MIRLLSVAGIAIFIGVIFSGCATVVVPDYSSYQYPAPPDTARLKLADIAHGRDDFGRSFFEILAGSGKGDALVQPSGVTFDTSGNLIVIDPLAGGIVIFDRDQKKVRTFADGNMKLPLGGVVNKKNELYLADPRARAVLVYAMDGTFLREIGNMGEFVNPASVAVDDLRDRVYICDSHLHAIVVHNTKGDSLTTIGSRGGGELQFNFPTNITLDRDGNLYVVDAMNFRVQIISPEGKFIRQFGSNGDGLGQFARPRGIAVDIDKNIYVSDVIFNNVQIFGSDGLLRLFIGSTGNLPGQFASPSGIAFDGKNKIAVVDQQNRRVQIFQYLGQPNSKTSTLGK